jgi:hypothetical protein
MPLVTEDTVDELYYYEAQISFLITGVDECLYTSYCLVDTYHQSEPDHKVYLEAPTFIEPATGGFTHLRYPLWNPREFFLCVLSIRLEQVIGESQILLDAFEERMNAYVSRSHCLLLYIYNMNHSEKKLSLSSSMTET